MTVTTTGEDLNFELFEREDEFGPYLSSTNNSGFQPSLDDFPAHYTAEQKKAALEAALKLVPEPETPVEMSRNRSLRTQSMYLSFDAKFKDVQVVPVAHANVLEALRLP